MSRGTKPQRGLTVEPGNRRADDASDQPALPIGNSEGNTGRERSIMIGAFWVLALVYMCGTTVADPDLWGHTLYGLRSIELGVLTEKTDPYSYTAPHAKWVNHEWLTEYQFGWLWLHAGGVGLWLWRKRNGLGSLGVRGAGDSSSPVQRRGGDPVADFYSRVPGGLLYVHSTATSNVLPVCSGFDDPTDSLGPAEQSFGFGRCR